MGFVSLTPTYIIAGIVFTVAGNNIKNHNGNRADLRYLCKIANRKKVFYLWRPWLKDPKDDMVLELAVAAKSKYIITYNLKDFSNIQKFGIEAITPGRFLRILKEV